MYYKSMTQLSLFSIFFLVLSAAFPFVLCIIQPTSAIVLLSLYLPPAALVLLVHATVVQCLIDYDILIRLFITGFFPGIVVAFSCELILSAAFAILFLGDQKNSIFRQYSTYQKDNPTAGINDIMGHIQLQTTLGLFLFLLAMSFIAAALVEESLKVWAARGQYRQYSNIVDSSTGSTKFAHQPVLIILSMTFAGMGFATIESIGYSFSLNSFSHQIAIAWSRNLTSTPIHVICAALTGIGLVRYEFGISHQSSKLRALLPAIMLHGSFNLQAYLISVFLAPNIDATINNFVSVVISMLFVIGGSTYLTTSLRNLDLPLLTVQWAKEQYTTVNTIPEVEERAIYNSPYYV